jgi:hypothetical protein
MFIKKNNGDVIDYITNTNILDKITMFMSICIVLFTIIGLMMIYIKPKYIINEDKDDPDKLNYTKLIIYSLLASILLTAIIHYFCMC